MWIAWSNSDISQKNAHGPMPFAHLLLGVLLGIIEFWVPFVHRNSRMFFLKENGYHTRKGKIWSYFIVQKHLNFVKLHYNRCSMAHVTLITIINISVVYVLVVQLISPFENIFCILIEFPMTKFTQYFLHLGSKIHPNKNPNHGVMSHNTKSGI